MSIRAAVSLPPLAALLVLCSGCGSISDPLPPSLNIPSLVKDLTARQVGDKLIVDFTIPPLTTDGVVLKRLDGVDLRGGPGTGAAFDIGVWAERARKVDAQVEQPGPVHLEVPVEGWAGQHIVLGVRVAGPKGKFSGWSNLIELPVVQPLAPPEGVRADAAPSGVRVDWQMPEARPGLLFHVFRRAAEQKDEVLAGSAEKAPYIDVDARYGQQYTYTVEAAQRIGQVEAVSAASAPVSITPRDTFAPAVPAGLASIAATESIQLNWDPNAEPDLKGYRVYRAAEGEAMRLIGEPDTPNYGDRAIQAGKKYRYAVSAVDQLGNESAQSPPVEAAAQ